MKRLWLVVCLVSLSAFSWAFAQEPPAATDTKEWTVEDVLREESAAQFDISPDGQWTVWVKSQMDQEKGEEVSHLFLSSLTEKREIQLTRGQATHSNPRWSPDGALIGFLSTRPLPGSEKKEERAEEQLWLINPFGGEPWPVTELPRGVDTYVWKGKGPIVTFRWKDESTIVLAAREDPTHYERTVQERKDTSQAVEEAAHEPPVRLFLLSVKDKKLKRLTENNDWIDLLEVSPDGRWAVARHQRSLSFEFDHKVVPVLELVNLGTGEATLVAGDKRLLPTSVTWARDSRSFYFTTRYSSDPLYFTATITLLYHYEVESKHLQQVELDWEWGLGGDDEGRVQATEDGFITLLADGVRFRPARYRRKAGTWVREDIAGAHTRSLFDWSLAPNGNTLVYDYSTPSQPRQWYRAQLSGARVEGEERLTNLNPSYAEKPLARTEVVRWTGGGGETVEGLLYYPLGYEPDRKYPLLLILHGGPLDVDLDRWFLTLSRPLPLYPQRGTFVLRVNYHGSGNYGLAWAESICCGKFYELERLDLKIGVDWLIERGLVDPDKLGVMGWSNGAILAIDLVLHDPRFKALSAGAGNVEYFGDFGLVSFSATWDNYYFGAAPYENPELYVRKSPYFRLKDVSVPTLIHTGTEDRAVGAVNAWNHFRILQQATQTPVKLVLYPGEPHDIGHFVHQRRKLEEDLAWFDRYLFGTYKEPNEAFKEGSPLDVALKRTRIQKAGTRYGVEAKGTLIPEVVKHKDLELGRFEVTRAQLAAFDRAYRFEPGTENFPANNVNFEQAQAYAAWLAELTGATYRLPNEDEVKGIYEAARESENTLDYWAGYTPNPDDAARLAKKVEELPGTAPLLREVGQFRGHGKEELVFDLGGNVAEWVIGADGSGELLGGSADRAADPKAPPQHAAEAYRGFRVVRGAPKKKAE